LVIRTIEANTLVIDLGARQRALEEELAQAANERDAHSAAAEQKAQEVEAQAAELQRKEVELQREKANVTTLSATLTERDAALLSRRRLLGARRLLSRRRRTPCPHSRSRQTPCWLGWRRRKETSKVSI
jgi:hypothetical protein